MIPDTEVLRRTGLPGIDTMLTKAQLRWSGHIVRMGEERLPKRLLYGELQEGKRSVGGQRKRYKDTLKVALNNFQINPDTWEDAAANRSEWLSCIAEGATGYEEDGLTRAENKRRIRKTFSVSSSSTQSHICTNCGKSFRAAIGLFCHKRTHRGSDDFTVNTSPTRGMSWSSSYRMDEWTGGVHLSGIVVGSFLLSLLWLNNISHSKSVRKSE